MSVVRPKDQIHAVASRDVPSSEIRRQESFPKWIRHLWPQSSIVVQDASIAVHATAPTVCRMDRAICSFRSAILRIQDV